MNLDGIWFAEYSRQQNAFHVETAREAMQNNLRQIAGGWTNSFSVFAVCGSRTEASEACDTLSAEMGRRGGRPAVSRESVVAAIADWERAHKRGGPPAVGGPKAGHLFEVTP